MRGFLPSLHTDPRMPTPSPAWVVPSGALSLCPQPPAALVTRAGTQRDHRIPGWGTDQDTAQPTEPSLQQLKGKLPFEFLLDAIQLLIRGKWQNKQFFPLNLKKHLSPSDLLANKLNNDVPFWLRGPHGWHDRIIYSNIYTIPKLVQDNKAINWGNHGVI